MMEISFRVNIGGFGSVKFRGSNFLNCSFPKAPLPVIEDLDLTFWLADSKRSLSPENSPSLACREMSWSSFETSRFVAASMKISIRSRT